MPIYEYHCSSCGKDFEELVFGNPSAINCPKCNGSEVKKRMSAASFKSGNKIVSSAGGSGCGSCSSSSCGTCGSN